MTKAQEIRAYIKANPGKTTPEIAAAVNWTVQRVSAMLWTEQKKPKPVIRREGHHISASNTPVYSYFYDDNLPAMVKAEVKVGTPAVDEDPSPRPGPIVRVETPAASAVEKPLSIEALADALARAIADQVVARVETHLAQALRNIIPQVPVTPLSVEQLAANVKVLPDLRPKKPTVLIAGLLPNQAGVISSEFDEVFDLRFFMMGDSLRKLRGMVATVDHVFTFTSKVSHGVEEVMTSAGHKINRCSGGMTMLKDQLVKLYADS